LFFDLIDLAKELQPKVVVAENVKGLLLGNAKQYVIDIYKAFDEAGYTCQHFLLNASKMGVPQKRERVFFIALRKDLAPQFMESVDMFTQLPKLELNFNEKEIPFKHVFEVDGVGEYKIPPSYLVAWNLRVNGDSDLSCTMGREFNRPNSFFSSNYIYKDKVSNTITGGEKNILFDEPRGFSKNEICKIGSYPLDYNFLKVKTGYLVGMSVPPLMTGKIAEQIYKQWLSKIK